MIDDYIDSCHITHHKPQNITEYIAHRIVRLLRFFADAFFSSRYGHRAVILETVAGVPGMVGGMMQHLHSLRRCKNDDGWIKALLDEAENERIHLMVFINIAQPNRFERLLIVTAQIVFFILYFIIYIISPKTAHRFVGYLEEEAVISYTKYLNEIDAQKIENIPAPTLAIDYWQLPADARLRDVIIAVRNDEMKHRDVNHGFADKIV